MRVLIIEDDHQLRALQRDLVENLGHEVDEATNAKDGLAMLKGDPDIELVLLDLGLPPAPQDITEGLWFLQEARLWDALLKVVVNITPTEKDNKVFGLLDKLIEAFVPDRIKNKEP